MSRLGQPLELKNKLSLSKVSIILEILETLSLVQPISLTSYVTGLKYLDEVPGTLGETDIK